MPGYRLQERTREGRNHLYPRVFDDVPSALDFAEQMLDRLAARPARRPTSVSVISLDTGASVASTTPEKRELDPDTCVACGAGKAFTDDDPLMA